MTTAQVVETSVTVNNNSPIQDYVPPYDQTQPTFEMTPGLTPFTKKKLSVYLGNIEILRIQNLLFSSEPVNYVTCNCGGCFLQGKLLAVIGPVGSGKVSTCRPLPDSHGLTLILVLLYLTSITCNISDMLILSITVFCLQG